MATRDHTYCLYLVKGGTEEPILEGEKSARRVGNVAAKLAKKYANRPGISVRITRDGKTLPSGGYGLDATNYEAWLEANQPEEEPCD